MSLTPLPTAPSRARPATFSSEADALLTALPTLVDELNAVAIGESASALALNIASALSGLGTALVGHYDPEDYFLSALQSGINQQLGLFITRNTTPTDPRFGGISGGSWHTAINAAAAYAGTNGLGLLILPQSGGYPITDTVTVPDTVLSFSMRGAYLTYSGTHDRPALVIGTTAVLMRGANIKGVDVRSSGAPDWTNTAYVGVQTYNLNRSKLDIARIDGFYVGLDCLANNTSGWAYNEIKQGYLTDNCRATRLRSVGVNCFVNENSYYGGRYGCSSSATGMGTAYGVEITSDGNYNSHNANRWYSPCFELNATVGVTRVPMFFNGAGSYCQVYSARHESSGGVFAVCDAQSRSGAAMHNWFDVIYSGGSFAVDDITQRNGAIGNVYNSNTPGAKLRASYVAPDVVACVKPRAANASWLTGPWSYYTNGSATIRKVTDSTVEVAGRKLGSYLRISSSASVVGLQLRTDQCKQWLVRAKCDGTANYGRLVVRGFDATGTQVSGGTVLTSVQYNSTAAAVASTANFGGAYQSSSDGVGKACILLVDSTVASMHVGVSGGSAPAHLQGMDLFPMDGGKVQAVSVFCSEGESERGYATADPGTVACFGSMVQGEIVGNGTAALAAVQGWMCTTGGSNAVAWVTGTAYVAGQRRYNGANVYVATSAGNAGATAPTGTGTGISDGVVTWDFLETRLVTAALPAL